MNEDWDKANLESSLCEIYEPTQEELDWLVAKNLKEEGDFEQDLEDAIGVAEEADERIPVYNPTEEEIRSVAGEFEKAKEKKLQDSVGIYKLTKKQVERILSMVRDSKYYVCIAQSGLVQVYRDNNLDSVIAVFYRSGKVRLDRPDEGLADILKEAGRSISLKD